METLKGVAVRGERKVVISVRPRLRALLRRVSKRPALSITLLNAVHAGGGLSWDSVAWNLFFWGAVCPAPLSKLKIHERDRGVDHSEHFDAEEHQRQRRGVDQSRSTHRAFQQLE